MQFKTVLLNRVYINYKKVAVYYVAAIAIIDREFANRPSSIYQPWYIAGVGCNQAYTFNKFQNFPNPPSFKRM